MTERRDESSALLAALSELGAEIRDRLLVARSAAAEDLAAVHRESESDTLYAVDRIGEEALVRSLAGVAASIPLRLVAEGLPTAGVVLPDGATPRWCLIVDPIDGTRGLMHDKRSAWFLAAAAPDRGPATRLREVELGVQIEIPTTKQGLCDEYRWSRELGLEVRRLRLADGAVLPHSARPSAARELAHGFATFVRFFPGWSAEIGAIEDALIGELSGGPVSGRAWCFEDQYASNGGQLADLASGRDLFVADLRPLIAARARREGRPAPICAHPYDLCTVALAEAGGVLVRDPAGDPLDAPLDTTTEVAWVGYANAALERSIAPRLRAILEDRGYLALPETRR